jgi:hypothetical protein
VCFVWEQKWSKYAFSFDSSRFFGRAKCFVGRASSRNDVVVPFRLRLKKREQQKTPNDARRVEGRRDRKKSTARRREESERIFRRHFSRAKKRQRQTRGQTRSASRRFWVGIRRFGTARFVLTFFFISLSLSFIVALFKNTQIGKTKITLPPPKEIAKYACYILGLWAFVAGMFGALLSISVKMRRYKYRSLPQKFIGKFKYGDTADITYPTHSRGLYPWIAVSAPCSLTTDGNPNSYVNNKNVTLWPTCVPSDTVSNPNRFPVDAPCGTPCQNP